MVCALILPPIRGVLFVHAFLVAVIEVLDHFEHSVAVRAKYPDKVRVELQCIFFGSKSLFASAELMILVPQAYLPEQRRPVGRNAKSAKSGSEVPASDPVKSGLAPLRPAAQRPVICLVARADYRYALIIQISPSRVV
jgi:hypothetical protein